MLLLQEDPEASGGKVGGASGGLGGVNLGVSEVGQPFAIGCHPPCEKKRKDDVLTVKNKLLLYIVHSDFSDQ